MEIPEYKNSKAFLEHLVKSFIVPQYSVNKLKDACSPFKPPVMELFAAQCADIAKYFILAYVAYDIGSRVIS